MKNKNDKKIAFLITSFRPGGGERVMLDLTNGFANAGFDIDLLVVKPVGQYKTQIDTKVNVLSMDAGRLIFSIPKIISYLKKERPGVIVATDEYTHIMSLIAAKLSGTGTKVVLRMGNMFSVLFSKYKRIRDKLIPLIAKTIYKYAYRVVANSQGVAKDVSEMFGIPIEMIKVIHNPKNIEEIRSKAAQKSGHPWLDDKTTPVVLFVGRLREQKNLPLLIKAFAKAREKMPARLVLVGMGREQKRLEKLVEELNLGEFVSFAGFSGNPYAFMSKADVFISTSLWEGLSNSLVEAVVCGAPIIASDCDSGSREIIAPDTDPLFRIKEGIECAKYGVLVPVGSLKDTVAALEKMLSDSDLRADYKKKTPERAENFRLESILEQYKSAMGIK